MIYNVFGGIAASVIFVVVDQYGITQTAATVC